MYGGCPSQLVVMARKTSAKGARIEGISALMPIDLAHRDIVPSTGGCTDVHEILGTEWSALESQPTARRENGGQEKTEELSRRGVSAQWSLILCAPFKKRHPILPASLYQNPRHWIMGCVQCENTSTP